MSDCLLTICILLAGILSYTSRIIFGIVQASLSNHLIDPIPSSMQRNECSYLSELYGFFSGSGGPFGSS